MNNRKILAANWKMNLDLKSAEKLTQGICDQWVTDMPAAILCPSYPFLSHLVTAVQKSSQHSIYIGSQDVSSHDQGAYTSEVSASQLSSLGVSYVIVGHSERRKHHSEDDKTILAKIRLLIRYGLKPIFCFGEELEHRRQGRTEAFIAEQLNNVLMHLDIEDLDGMILAYEPIWAIGTGNTASPLQAQEVHSLVRSLVRDKFGESASETMPILYGGSCKPENAREIFAEKDIDGGLIGGASLQVDSFITLGGILADV